MFSLKKNQKAFSLIEMIIAVSIFVLVLVIATNIYLVINNTQRKVVTMQRIQSDVRYLFEAIAQEVRLGQIDYDFYSENSIDFHPDSGTDNTVLAVVNRSGNSIFFRLSSSGDKAQYCEIDADNDCDLLVEDNWQNVTPEGVKVEHLRFVITPSADPFTDVTAIECVADSGKTGACATVYGYSCSISADCPIAPCYCRYYSDGHNFQPKVQIILKARGTARNIAEESEMIMQTTVTSRIISSEVKNNYYD
jgi:prepilin-type N-terminal cleavage/methylation domain-containing protein